VNVSDATNRVLAQPRERLVALLAVAGGACVVAGAALPWLSVYDGLDTYSGTAGMNGRLLVTGGSAAVLIGLWYGRRRAAPLRYLMGALGFALAGFTAYLVAELLAVYKQLQGAFLPALGPGVFVAATGALLLLSTLFVEVRPAFSVEPRTRARGDPTATLLISLSVAAGTVHLAVAADHFSEYVLYGVFFVVVGSAQVVWAMLVALAGAARPLLLLSIGNAIVVALWIASRTSGIPLGPNAGNPEPVGYADTLTTAFEVALVACAVWLLLGRRSRPTMPAVLGAIPFLIAPAGALAVLSAVGAVGFLPASG
jgi:hypothetical protein